MINERPALFDSREEQAYEQVKNTFRKLEADDLSAGSIAYFAIFWLVGQLVGNIGKERTAKLLQNSVDDIDEEPPIKPTMNAEHEDDKPIPIGTPLEQQVYEQITKLFHKLEADDHSVSAITYWVFSWWLDQMVDHTGNRHAGITLQRIIGIILDEGWLH